MQKLKAYRVFQFEIKELKLFLSSTRYAFAKITDLRNFIRDKNHKQYLEDNGFDTSPRGIRRNLSNSSLSNLGRTLNQQTLVRVISALEIFLVDIFRDVFIHTKMPFKDQLKVHQYNQAQLLSLKSISELFNEIINKECRSLSSGGFGEINKAYKKRLKIDLSHISPGKKTMTEYHEIRHLIVHKLGRTDSKYREKYKLSNKGGVYIDDEYLASCIKDIDGFAEQTHELVSQKINELISPSKLHSHERKVKYHIEVLDSTANLDFLNTDFEFWINDEFEVLKNILLERKALNEKEFEITLAGTRRQIKTYYSFLKYAKKKNTISLMVVEDIFPLKSDKIETPNKKKKTVYVEKAIIELIRQQLPEQPWETGIHKKVAEALGLKNKIAFNGIKILIQEGIFKQQIDGILIEGDGRDLGSDQVGVCDLGSDQVNPLK